MSSPILDFQYDMSKRFGRCQRWEEVYQFTKVHNKRPEYSVLSRIRDVVRGVLEDSRECAALPRGRRRCQGTCSQSTTSAQGYV